MFWKAKCRVQTGRASTYHQYVKFVSHIPEGRRKFGNGLVRADVTDVGKKEEGKRKKEEGKGKKDKINNLRNLKGANRPGGCYAKHSGDLRFYILELLLKN